MDRRPRVSAAALTAMQVPTDRGVYAWHRRGRAVYVGKAKNLHGRVWNHMGLGGVMTGSAFRRNVAAHLGIASAADIKERRYMPTQDDVTAVNKWIRSCSVAWIACATPEDAVALERRMKGEWMPPLTKI